MTAVAERPDTRPAAVPAVAPPVDPTPVDPSTRARVARTILEHGPATAAALAARVGLTSAAVRKHLDALIAAGELEGRLQTLHGPRGRGRPARVFALTDRGHAAMTTAYDDLAASALRFLAEVGGPQAVERFAEARVADLERRYLPLVDRAGSSVEARTDALAAALSADGYAASTRPGAAGTQLCQGHCPVQHVATEFPQLCDAETAVFSRLVGAPVQRLATLAHGEHVCTTHVSHSSTANGRTPS